MKYIRTKDGRIVEEDKLETGLKQTSIVIKSKKDNYILGKLICDNLDDALEIIVIGEYCKCHSVNPKDIKYEKTILFNDILKQADTIEELCDEFICGDNYKAHCVLSSESFENSYWKERLLDNDKTVIIYGAIWTEWGLKYVAKMNEKGELELL